MLHTLLNLRVSEELPQAVAAQSVTWLEKGSSDLNLKEQCSFQNNTTRASRGQQGTTFSLQSTKPRASPLYLQVKSDSEQHAGTTADPEATEEEQPSSRGLHDEHLVSERDKEFTAAVPFNGI